MAFSAGEFGEVHAYEANPLIHEYAKLSAWLNGLESHSLYFYNFAISDVSGKEILFDGGASTYVGKVLTNDDIEYYTYGAINLFTAIKSIFAYFGVISYQSYTMSVDDIMSNHANKTLNFLRADIEGSECRMLQGAVKSIPQFPDIIIFMEWEPTSIKKLSTEQDISFCVQFLKNEDFKLLQLDVNYADLDLKLTNETLKLIDIEHLLNKGDKGEYILLRDLNVVDSILSICSNCRDHDVLSFDNNTNIQDSFGFSSFNLSQEITFTETGDL